MLADRYGVELLGLEASVEADVDVRGTLLVDDAVPVGFQAMRCGVSGQVPGVDARQLATLGAPAERCCVVMQTLRGGVDVAVEWALELAGSVANASD